eukprot:745897-Hanusia_phi.AAC.4
MNDAKVLSNFRWKYLTVDEGHRIKNKVFSKCSDSQMLLFTSSRLHSYPSSPPILPVAPGSHQAHLALSLLPLTFLSSLVFPSPFPLHVSIILVTQDCKLLRELKNLNAGNRLLLTGTPLQEEQHKIISKLHAILDPFLLRRLKSDVALELPDKHVYVLFASFSPLQARYNQAIANNSLHELLENVTDSVSPTASSEFFPLHPLSCNLILLPLSCSLHQALLPPPTRPLLLPSPPPAVRLTLQQDDGGTALTNPRSSLDNMMMQMRKCCNHPYLFASPVDQNGEFVIDERVLEASGKMQLLDRMLRILKENGNKVLIFFQVKKCEGGREGPLTLLQDDSHDGHRGGLREERSRMGLLSY